MQNAAYSAMTRPTTSRRTRGVPLFHGKSIAKITSSHEEMLPAFATRFAATLSYEKGRIHVNTSDRRAERTSGTVDGALRHPEAQGECRGRQHDAEYQLEDPVQPGGPEPRRHLDGPCPGPVALHVDRVGLEGLHVQRGADEVPASRDLLPVHGKDPVTFRQHACCRGSA